MDSPTQHHEKFTESTQTDPILSVKVQRNGSIEELLMTPDEALRFATRPGVTIEEATQIADLLYTYITRKIRAVYAQSA